MPTSPKNSLTIKKLTLLLALLFFLWGSTIHGGVDEWTTNGPFGGFILTIATHPTDAKTLYAATGLNGLFHSTDGGESWTQVDFGLEYVPWIGDVDIHPTSPNVIYAADFTRAMALISQDGGATWTQSTVQAFSLLYDLAPDPVDPSTLYAGTYKGRDAYGEFAGGVLKSIDFGITWSDANEGLRTDFIYEEFVIRKIVVDPSDRMTLYAGADRNDLGGMIFKSIDGAATWTAVEDWDQPLAQMNVWTLLMDPSSPGTIYTGGVARAAEGGAFFRSEDGGETWTAIDDDLRNLSGFRAVTDLAFDPETPSRMYAGLSRAGTRLASVWASDDGGNSWMSQGQGLSSDLIWDLAPAPGEATLYAGTEHGVFKKTGQEASWQPSHTGLSNNRVDALIAQPTDPVTLQAAVLGKGLTKSDDGGQSWPEGLGDLHTVRARVLASDPNDESILYLGTALGDIYKSVDAGASWFVPGAGVAGTDILDLIVHPQASQLFAASLFQSASLIWIGGDGGRVWSHVGTIPRRIETLAADPTDPQILYAGADSGIVYKSLDGGVTWTGIAVPGLGIEDVVAMAVDPRHPNIVYLAASYITTTDVYKSLDGGANWVPVNEGLDDGGVENLVIDPEDPATIYLGTRWNGVFKTTDGAANWTDLHQGLGSVQGGRVVLNPNDPRQLFLGTSRGVYEYTQSTERCPDDPTVLCIDHLSGDNRFRVTLDFETTQAGGSAGQALAESLAPLGISDGGILSFFNPANPEVLVKVLDGCAINGHFWVFYAASTNVGFELTVEDSLAAEKKIYVNPDIHPAETVADNMAFATCSATPSSPLRDQNVAVTYRELLRRERDETRTPISPVTATDAPSGSQVCRPNATTLCLGDDRFAVTLRFETTQGGGSEGDAGAIPIAALDIDDGGVFYFFNPANPEVLVKILDGCPINDRVWFFAAATTTVGFVLTVEDKITGVQKTYTNPDLTTATTITDTDAFMTCSATAG